MRVLSLFLGLLCFQKGFAQQIEAPKPIANLRVSFLLFPFSPLLTLEVRTLGNLTLQLESNFTDTHGINLKYYLQNSMDGGYLFTGLALVENKFLREDKQITYLPYAGVGYAYRWGKQQQWTFDSRIGLGATTNADSNAVYPVIKTGIGRVF